MNGGSGGPAAESSGITLGTPRGTGGPPGNGSGPALADQPGNGTRDTPGGLPDGAGRFAPSVAGAGTTNAQGQGGGSPGGTPSALPQWGVAGMQGSAQSGGASGTGASSGTGKGSSPGTGAGSGGGNGGVASGGGSAGARQPELEEVARPTQAILADRVRKRKLVHRATALKATHREALAATPVREVALVPAAAPVRELARGTDQPKKRIYLPRPSRPWGRSRRRVRRRRRGSSAIGTGSFRSNAVRRASRVHPTGQRTPSAELVRGPTGDKLVETIRQLIARRQASCPPGRRALSPHDSFPGPA